MKRIDRFHAGVLAVPALWLGLFVLVPFVIIAVISLAQGVDAQPPFRLAWS